MLKRYSKSAGFTVKILITAKSAGYSFKILLLVSKPTGHEVPRCCNNLQLCLYLKFDYGSPF